MAENTRLINEVNCNILFLIVFKCKSQFREDWKIKPNILMALTCLILWLFNLKVGGRASIVFLPNSMKVVLSIEIVKLSFVQIS